MKQIQCAECGKHLFDTDKSDGAAMSVAQKLGFVAKMPFLYGVNGCFFFCDKECHKEWSKKNISPEAKEAGDCTIAEIKAKTPEMVEGLARGLNTLSKAINAIRNNKK